MKTSSVRISAKEKIEMFSNLGTMLTAGIPILGAVISLLEEAKGNTAKVLETVKKDLEAGQVLNDSFAKFPRSFDKVTVSLVKAAEEAGTLEVALKDLKEGIRKEMEFNDKIKSALMYPVFVMFVFVGVMLMMLVVVIPRIATVFNRLKVDLPLPTKLMIFASNALIYQWHWVLVGFAIIIAAILLLFRYQRLMIVSAFASLPMISGLVRQIDTARFARSMYLLLNSGLPIVVALELSKDIMSKKEMRDLIHNARQMVIDGKRFAEGLRTKRKLMSGMTVKLIEVGERSGTLNQSMKDISESLDYKITRDLQTATGLLEPIMLVFVGLVVGGMMMSIIGPIYGLISGVQVAR
jgi:type II secretory pathway component PulF